MSSITEGTCPKCEKSMQGDPIPEKYQQHYAEGTTHYSNLIGVEYPYGDPQRYDGVSEWRCPFCGYREGRWTRKELQEGEVETRFGGQ